MLDFGYYNMDCMAGMREFPDNYFELAIVDPPYGDGGGYWSGPERFGGRFDRYRGQDFTGNSTPSPTGGTPDKSGGGTGRTDILRTDSEKASVSRTGGTWAAKFGKKSSRGTSRREKSISKNFSASHGIRLYGGGNYFELPANRCFLIWRKTNVPESFSMAMCEYAWTSFNDNAKWFEMSAVGQQGRFHPTQKPVELYKWILDNYAKPGDKILDTHVGSASSLIACEDLGFKYVGFEIDEDYYKLGTERIVAHTAQMTISDLLGDWRFP